MPAKLERMLTLLGEQNVATLDGKFYITETKIYYGQISVLSRCYERRFVH